MSDLISRQAAMEHFKKRLYETAMNNLDLAGVFSEMADNRVETWINELPTAEKNGKWIPQDHNYKHGNVSTCLYFAPVCSECGNTGDFKMNYCPNCGARMED